MQSVILNTIRWYNGNELLKEANTTVTKKEKKIMCPNQRCRPVFLGRHTATTTTNSNLLIINVDNVCCDYIIQGDKLTFYIDGCITYPTTSISNVILNINGTQFNLYKFGRVKWDSIKPYRCYNVIIGTEEPSATIINEIGCTKFDFPVYQTDCTTEVQNA